MTRRPRPAAMVAILFVITVGLSGCGSTVPSSGPSASTDATRPPSAAASDDVGTLPPVDPGPILDGQTETDTDIGRIWDTVPRGFPLYPGATRSDEARDGPSSGVYVVEGDPQTIATWFREELQTAAFGTRSLSGPLEDGSFELDSEGHDPACRLRVDIAPLGSLTALTILYGAGCPHA